MSNKETKQKLPTYLYNYLVRKINLPDFLETEIGCKLNWYEENVSAATVCPLPDHSEAKPSFRLNLMDNGDWIFHCFGCNAKGNIIHFCRDYYGYDTLYDAAQFLCEKFKIEESPEMAACVVNPEKKNNLEKKAQCANVVSSNQCRILLEKSYEKHNKWVKQAYEKLNEAMDKNDVDAIEIIGYEAFNKMQEK
jgi:hypothetical protein